jgi:Spy/CpxP family protein refolding chaperone
MRIRKSILVTLAAAALVVPTVLWAAEHFGRGGMGFDMGAGPFAMGAGNVLRLAGKLGLSTDQITQIKAVLSAAKSANQPTRDQIKTNRQAFNAAYDLAHFDAAAVNAYVAQQTPLVQQLAVSAFQTRAKVLAVLTPAQAAQLKQLKAEYKAWWASRPGRS